jgi:signal transduction histidine kinase
VALRTAQLKTEIEERQLVEQRRVMEEERTRVAQDLHDELGAGLTEVDILGALVQNPQIESEKKQGYLGELREVSRSLVAGLDEIVWAVNPRYDSVADLAGYYSLFAQRFLNLAGITCRLRVAESIPEHPLDSRLRHGIFLAFKEVLNNVVRHAQATEVELAIGVVDQELKIAVADNGRGFQGAGANPGSDGVTGMKQRMQKLGGDCRIHSEPGRGTTVELRLPLGRNHS